MISDLPEWTVSNPIYHYGCITRINLPVREGVLALGDATDLIQLNASVDSTVVVC